METINVTLPEGTNLKEPVIIQILEGKAPEPINLKAISISGGFNAVLSWWLHREKIIDKDKAYVEVDLEAGTMVLIVNEGHPHQTTVTSKVERARLLQKLKIETGQRFSNKDLSQVLRTNRILFADKDKHGELLGLLSKFTAKANVELEQMDDKRGNTKDMVEAKLSSDIPPSFTLNTPVIQGGEAKSFEVNICMEIREKGVSFWLESTEMEEIFMEETKTLLAGEASKLEGIAIIYK